MDDTEGRKAVIAEIMRRRSVRAFTPEAVPDEAIRAIVEAALAAPKGGNRQTTRFIALRNAASIKMLHDAVEARVERLGQRITSPKAQRQFLDYAGYFTLFESAPAVIVVLARPYDSMYARIIEKYVPADERPVQRLVEVDSMTAAAAVENLLLAAQALGFGACFMTGAMVAQEEIERALGVESPWHAVALVPVGRPAGESEPREKPPIDELLTFERFNP